jgi:16S rRNA G1207 methylase RsmC
VARQNVGGKTISDKMEEVFGNVEVLFRNAGYSIYISINQ